jgi:hypothetical protein
MHVYSSTSFTTKLSNLVIENSAEASNCLLGSLSLTFALPGWFKFVRRPEPTRVEKKMVPDQRNSFCLMAKLAVSCKNFAEQRNIFFLQRPQT